MVEISKAALLAVSLFVGCAFAMESTATVSQLAEDLTGDLAHDAIPCQSRAPASTVKDAWKRCPIAVLGERLGAHERLGWGHRRRSPESTRRQRRNPTPEPTPKPTPQPPPTPAPTPAWTEKQGACRKSNGSSGNQGYDYNARNKNENECKQLCLDDPSCKAVETSGGGHCEIWNVEPPNSNGYGGYSCFVKVASTTAGVLATVVNSAVATVAGEVHEATASEEVTATITQQCPDMQCDHGCVVASEVQECGAPDLLSIGYCLETEWTLAATCVMHKWKCINEEEETTQGRKLLGSMVAAAVTYISAGRGTFNFYTKVCEDTDSNCAPGAFMGKIEIGEHANGFVDETSIVQLAAPGECVTRCEVAEKFAETGSCTEETGRKLLGSNAAASADEVDALEYCKAIKLAFGCDVAM